MKEGAESKSITFTWSVALERYFMDFFFIRHTQNSTSSTRKMMMIMTMTMTMTMVQCFKMGNRKTATWVANFNIGSSVKDQIRHLTPKK
jgi:hypothetical protein